MLLWVQAATTRYNYLKNVKRITSTFRPKALRLEILKSFNMRMIFHVFMAIIFRIRWNVLSTGQMVKLHMVKFMWRQWRQSYLQTMFYVILTLRRYGNFLENQNVAKNFHANGDYYRCIKTTIRCGFSFSFSHGWMIILISLIIYIPRMAKARRSPSIILYPGLITVYLNIPLNCWHSVIVSELCTQWALNLLSCIAGNARLLLVIFIVI